MPNFILLFAWCFILPSWMYLKTNGVFSWCIFHMYYAILVNHIFFQSDLTCLVMQAQMLNARLMSRTTLNNMYLQHSKYYNNRKHQVTLLYNRVKEFQSLFEFFFFFYLLVTCICGFEMKMYFNICCVCVMLRNSEILFLAYSRQQMGFRGLMCWAKAWWYQS